MITIMKTAWLGQSETIKLLQLVSQLITMELLDLESAAHTTAGDTRSLSVVGRIQAVRSGTTIKAQKKIKSLESSSADTVI